MTRISDMIALTVLPTSGAFVPIAVTGSLVPYRFDLSGLRVVTPQMFGAVGDGVTNDAVAIQAAWNYAFANSIPCHNPGAHYALGASLTIDTNGWNLTGDGWENTRFIPTGAFPAIIVKALFGKAEGIGCWGTASGSGIGPGTYGWVFKNAGGCEIISCQGRNFATDGALISPTYGVGAAGNNNCLKFRAGGYNANGACGIRMAQHLDNNNIEFSGVEASANVLHGLLGKSSKGNVDFACIFEGNGGYGLQIGEDADGSSNLDWQIEASWDESNTLGGVRGSATSANCKIDLMGQSQSYTGHASAGNTVETVIGGGLRRIGNDGASWVSLSANSTSAFVSAVDTTGAANVDLRLSGQGTGVVISEDDLTLSSGKVLKVGANQVVGARQTGWAADTGTAKKTANATYTAGVTLTYSVGYVQAEQTAMATRMAAVEAALQDATQTIKALKDAQITHGQIGA